MKGKTRERRLIAAGFDPNAVFEDAAQPQENTVMRISLKQAKSFLAPKVQLTLSGRDILTDALERDGKVWEIDSLENGRREFIVTYKLVSVRKVR